MLSRGHDDTAFRRDMKNPRNRCGSAGFVVELAGFEPATLCYDRLIFHEKPWCHIDTQNGLFKPFFNELACSLVRMKSHEIA